MKMEPLSFGALFPLFIATFSQIESSPCCEANSGPVVVGIVAVLDPGTSNSPFVLFDPQDRPFYTPKTLPF